MLDFLSLVIPKLASCPWGLVTANGVDLLTEIYVILMPNSKPIGQTAWAGGSVTDGRKARKHIMMISTNISHISSNTLAEILLRLINMYEKLEISKSLIRTQHVYHCGSHSKPYPNIY